MYDWQEIDRIQGKNVCSPPYFVPIISKRRFNVVLIKNASPAPTKSSVSGRKYDNFFSCTHHKIERDIFQNIIHF